MEKLEINKINEINLDTQDGQEAIKEQLKILANDPSINKPSEKEIEQYKVAYEEATQDFAIKRWEIGDAKSGGKIMDYLRHYTLVRHMWKENEWMGVIKLQEELDLVEKAYEAGGKKAAVNFSYQAVEFILSMLKSPGGIGFQSAMDFEQEAELYAEIFNMFGIVVTEARKILQDLDFAQQKWAAGAQGFYLEKELDPIEETPEEGGDNGIYFDKKLNKEVKPGDPGYNIEVFQSLMQEKYAAELAARSDSEALPGPTDHLEEEYDEKE